MSSTKDYFREQAASRMDQAQAIVDRIEAEGRRVTGDDKRQVEKLVDEAMAFKAKLKAIEDNEEMRASIEANYHQPISTETTMSTETAEKSHAPSGVGFKSEELDFFSRMVASGDRPIGRTSAPRR